MDFPKSSYLIWASPKQYPGKMKVTPITLTLVAFVGVALGVPYRKGDEEGLRLIKTSEDGAPKWMGQDEIWALLERHINFADVTDHIFPTIREEDISTKAIPTSLRFQSVVRNLLRSLSIPRLQRFVESFSSYYNRYYMSESGTESQQWLLAQIRESVRNYTGPVPVVVQEFAHTWPQSSIIARIPGASPTLRDEVVLVGAHQDSVNKAGASLSAPGADDNASGSAVLLESLRILVESGFVPQRTVEFHWYAAEEVGLRGSAAIAGNYSAGRVDVVGMMNFDVPGYNVGGGTEIGIYTDNTSPALNAFMRTLIGGYCLYGWRDRSCGYACSDHASWRNYGYPSAFPSEPVFHPEMHTLGDNYPSVSFTQVAEFTKLAVGYLVEMAEPA